MPKKLSMKYIYKQYHLNTNNEKILNYNVRMPVFTQGEAQPVSYNRKSHFFSQSKYGSAKKALDAAVKYRDSRLKKGNGLRLLRAHSNKGKPYKSTITNTSGVIGVTLYISDTGYSSYNATFTLGNKRQQTSFSISKYGECEAFKRACKVRYKQMGKITIVYDDAIPCLPDVPYDVN
ncbi:hypothetical protein MNBD_GAMMA11-3458 [hydrothermal vent metagenome]|uniref:Uncharacterized protein n=1 Tax=hydrothermal vent metagenome TaxID=652676 RepID=A0A3B0YCJ9_9ZZZZ